MTVLLVAELLVIGLIAGYLAGMLGIGGGMLMVPFLTLIASNRGVEPGLSVKVAIASSMATIMFTALSSLRAHHGRGAVRWDLVRTIAPGILAGGVLSGAGLFSVLKGQGLALFFAAFIGFSAVQMLLDRKPAPTRQLPGRLGQAGVGAAIGLLSGLVGAGGAFLTVPFLTWCNVPIRLAVGTAAALGFPIALANTLGYAIGGLDVRTGLPGAVGYLYVPAIAVIATASVLAAPYGARTAHRVDVKRLKRLFALLLFGLAGYMLYKSRA